VTLYNVGTTGGTTAYSVASDTVSLAVASTATAGFEGTSGANVMTGTTGNDVLVGNGGIDQIDAGSGNDKVVLNASNVSTLSAVNTGVINGNEGVNTLKLSGSDMLLDMTLAAVQNKVYNFSVMDITGTGNNTLKLNMLNLQTLSGAADNPNTAANENQMLVVHGDTGDAVILENTASWTLSNSLTSANLIGLYGAEYGFVTGTPIRRYSQYTKDGVTLIVDDSTAVADMVGTSGADVMTGTANADVIYGNGGADRISADVGNDVVILNMNSVATLALSNNAMIDGGGGVNTLKISGLNNNTLDLTNATVSGKVDNFSVIDLRQGSGNRIRINLQDVLDLSGATDNLATVGVDESKMLVIQGNGGNAVNTLQLADSANWTSVTNLGGTTMINTFGAEYGFEVGRSYTQYTNGLANLFVDQSLIRTLL
jgi:hypothetical protein